MTRTVRAMYGPFRGILRLDDDEAASAIKDGWAVDPTVPYKLPVNFDKARVLKAAEAAARRIRGEGAPKAKAAKPKAAADERAYEADRPAGAYETRTAEAEARKPGRPPKSESKSEPESE